VLSNDDISNLDLENIEFVISPEKAHVQDEPNLRYIEESEHDHDHEEEEGEKDKVENDEDEEEETRNTLNVSAIFAQQQTETIFFVVENISRLGHR
jgi:hypothetical protein